MLVFRYQTENLAAVFVYLYAVTLTPGGFFSESGSVPQTTSSGLENIELCVNY